MAGPRVRTKVPRTSGIGTRTLTTHVGGETIATTPEVQLEYHYCADEVGPQPYRDHDLQLFKKKSRPVLANGIVREDRPSLGHFSQYNYENYRFGHSQTGYCPPVPTPPWDDMVNSALAAINTKSSAPVDIGNFILELREIPRMLTDLRDLFSSGEPAWMRNDDRRKVAPEYIPGTYIGVEFGWKPLLTDLANLLNFTEDWHNRLRRLYQAGKERRIRRNLFETGSSKSLSSLPWVIAHSSETTLVDRRLDSLAKGWFTARLEPTLQWTGSYYEFDRLAWWNYMTTQPTISLWNSFPWTWLIDYFISIGDFLEAGTGLLPYRISWLNLMYKSVDSISYEVSGWRRRSDIEGIITYTGDVSFTSGSNTTDAKQRYVVASPTPRLWADTALTRKQVSILAALSFARALNRGGSGLHG